MKDEIFGHYPRVDLHNSPFSNLPSYQNDEDLSYAFVKKWVIPHYMEIGSYGDEGWDDRVKKVKHEITEDVCRLLLGTPRWEIGYVGAYFVAVKGYRNLIDIIGNSLLRMQYGEEVSMYVLVLAFFNDARCIEYLHRFLDYYLTTPSLDVNVESAMNAVLYLDRENKTNYFPGYLAKWELFKKEQTKRQMMEGEDIIKELEEREGKENVQRFIEGLNTKQNDPAQFSTRYLDHQVLILRDINQYSG